MDNINNEDIRDELQVYLLSTKVGGFPSAERRLAVNLNLSPTVKTIMTGHGNIPSYSQRLKIIGSPQCPCRHGIQTVDHLMFLCKMLKNEREILKSRVLKVGKWPVSKSELTNGTYISFTNRSTFI